jgi:ankyrin repeat protein
MMAVENGHFELAISLLDAGADPNDQKNGLSVLHAIVWVRKPDRGDDIESAPPPIGSGRLTSLQFVRELVARGADLDLQLQKGKSGKGILNQKGATPLLLAADTADVPLMRLLIELGADPMIPNADQCTPLMAAAGIGTIAPGEEAGTEEEALSAVGLLLELGADINEVDDNGETCMHGAAYKSSPRLVEYLAAHGADIEIWNRPNKYRWTPLDIAEGYRPGNFRPSADTIAAIHRVMREAGVEIPVGPRADRNLNNSDYTKKKK